MVVMEDYVGKYCQNYTRNCLDPKMRKEERMYIVGLNINTEQFRRDVVGQTLKDAAKKEGFSLTTTKGGYKNDRLSITYGCASKGNLCPFAFQIYWDNKQRNWYIWASGTGCALHCCHHRYNLDVVGGQLQGTRCKSYSVQMITHGEGGPETAGMYQKQTPHVSPQVTTAPKGQTTIRKRITTTCNQCGCDKHWRNYQRRQQYYKTVWIGKTRANKIKRKGLNRLRQTRKKQQQIGASTGTKINLVHNNSNFDKDMSSDGMLVVVGKEILDWDGRKNINDD